MPAPAAPTKCTAFLYLNDESGQMGTTQKAVLVVELQRSFNYPASGGTLIVSYRRTYAFASGYVETTTGYLEPADPLVTNGLVETQTLGLSPYCISVQYENGAGEFITTLQTSNVQIPNQATVDLSTLLTTG